MVSCRPSFTHWPAARHRCRCERGSPSFVAYRLSQRLCPHIHNERRWVAGRPRFSSVRECHPSSTPGLPSQTYSWVLLPPSAMSCNCCLTQAWLCWLLCSRHEALAQKSVASVVTALVISLRMDSLKQGLSVGATPPPRGHLAMSGDIV